MLCPREEASLMYFGSKGRKNRSPPNWDTNVVLGSGGGSRLEGGMTIRPWVWLLHTQGGEGGCGHQVLVLWAADRKGCSVG